MSFHFVTKELSERVAIVNMLLQSQDVLTFAQDLAERVYKRTIDEFKNNAEVLIFMDVFENKF